MKKKKENPPALLLERLIKAVVYCLPAEALIDSSNSGSTSQ